MKRKFIMPKILIYIFIIMLQSVLLFSQTQFTFDKNRAYNYLKEQTDMGVRSYGTEGHRKVREFIKNEMSSIGYDVKVHNFKAPYIANRYGQNFYAFLKGKSDKYIVIASHYDTRSVAEKDPSFTMRKKPIIGANDGASSTAVLLELMRVLKKKEGSLPYSIAFIFFDLEDDGNIYNKNRLVYDESNPLKTDWIQGSIMFAEDNIIPKNDIYFGILIDLIGSGDAVFKYETYSYRKFGDLYDYVWSTASDLGYSKYFSNSHWGSIIDDHYPFAYRGIPFIDIIDMGYKYHHTHEDTLDKMDRNTLAVVGNVVEFIVQNPPSIKY